MNGTPEILNNINKGIVENYIRTNGTVTKPQIAEGTGISLVTVSKKTNELLEEGVIIADGMSNSTGGRKAQQLRINPSYEYYCGVYYFEKKLMSFIFDATGIIVDEKITDFYDEATIDSQIGNIVNEMKNKMPDKKISMLGIGVPGVVHDGTILYAKNVPQMNNVKLQNILEESLGINILMENDVNLSTLGFNEQNKNMYKSMVLLYFGEGVGAGIIEEGKLLRGNTDFAGEVGNLPLFIKTHHENKIIYFERFENAVEYIHEKQKNNPDDPSLKKTFIDAISQALISITSLLNPSIVAISEDINKDNIFIIHNKISKVVGEENVPELITFKDINPYYKQGIICMCMDFIKNKYQRIK